ncbi:MAG: hypothetical protein JXA90_08810 [Planctomycetes bacterium]|nr:hypothetical protein [Planctomycetota bacterium]
MMKPISLLVVLGVATALASSCRKVEAPGAAKPAVLVTLPSHCHTPDGCTLTAGGDIILSVPNFNNKVLLAEKKIEKPAPALMVKIDKQNKLATWYEFQEKDLHADTGIVGPMGCDIGPDGNLYVADNQLFEDPAHKSRLLRINVEDGKAVSGDPVVVGFIVSNAVIWRGDKVYVSETMLETPAPPAEGKAPEKLRSGVYSISIEEWKDGPVQLKPWSADAPDPHLITTYETSGRIGFGADGLTFDEEGNLYCGIFEDGVIYKTAFDADGKPKETAVFAKADTMKCCDGIFWSQADKKIYVSDSLINGVHAVDLKGNVATVHSNGDTDGADGSLDQPCEVIVRGSELIVVNMDMPFPSDLLTNTKIDEPYTLSVIQLPKS